MIARQADTLGRIGLTAMVGLVLALSVIGAVAVAVGSARATTASSGRR